MAPFLLKEKKFKVYKIENSNIFIIFIEIISPVTFIKKRCIIPFKNCDLNNNNIWDVITIPISDLPEQLQLFGRTNFESIKISTFKFMTQVKLMQLFCVREAEGFNEFSKECLTEISDEIESYILLDDKILVENELLDHLLRFLTSIIVFNDNVRKYLAFKYGNIFPSLDLASRGRKMKISEVELFMNYMKRIFIKDEVMTYKNSENDDSDKYKEINMGKMLKSFSRSYDCLESETFFHLGSGISNIHIGFAGTQNIQKSIGIESDILLSNYAQIFIQNFYTICLFSNFDTTGMIHITSDYSNNILNDLYSSTPCFIFHDNSDKDDTNTKELVLKFNIYSEIKSKIVLTKRFLE